MLSDNLKEQTVIGVILQAVIILSMFPFSGSYVFLFMAITAVYHVAIVAAMVVNHAIRISKHGENKITKR